jgi:hypothetical protein
MEFSGVMGNALQLKNKSEMICMGETQWIISQANDEYSILKFQAADGFSSSLTNEEMMYAFQRGWELKCINHIVLYDIPVINLHGLV